MKKTKSPCHGHRFPAVVISCAVRWYFRFQLSLRDIEELLFERGVVVNYQTVCRWWENFGAGFADRVKADHRRFVTTSHLDEMCVTLRGEPYLLWRAADKHGAARHPVTGAPRPSGSQALLRASTGHMRCCTAQARHRSITQLSGGKSRNPRTDVRQTHVRSSRLLRAQ